MITKITADNIKKEVFDSPRPCVVKFYNKGCPLCSRLSLVYEKFSKKYGQYLKFGKVDTWEEDSNFYNKYLDGGIPTIQVFYKQLSPVLIPYPNKPDIHTGYGRDYLDKWFYNYILSFQMLQGNRDEK